jgi:hypothetical protein
VTVSASNQLWGVEANLLDNAWHGGVPLGEPDFPYGEWRVELQGGFRFLDLHENLNINQGSNLLSEGVASFLGSTVVAPNLLTLQDSFATRNQFYGGQIGAHVEWVHGCWFVDVVGKLALGVTHETVVVNGITTLTPILTLNTTPPQPVFGTPTAAVGGLLATSTNIGHPGRTAFALVPEVGLTAGYQCGQYVRFFTGYTFLYWDRVVRPGNQIDSTVNLTQVPIHPSFGPLTGPAQPIVPLQQTDFWAQGLSFGVEIRF